MNMQEIYKGLENDPTHHSYYSILSAIPYDPEKIAAMDEKDYRHLLASLHDLASHSIGRLLRRIVEEPVVIEEGSYDKKLLLALRKSIEALSGESYRNVISVDNYMDQLVILFDVFDVLYFYREQPFMDMKEVAMDISTCIQILINELDGYDFSGNEEKLVIIYGLSAILCYWRDSLVNKTLDNRLANQLKTMLNTLNNRFNIIDHYETLTAMALYHIAHNTQELMSAVSYVDSLFDHKSPKKLMNFLHDFYGERIKVDIGVVDCYEFNVTNSSELFNKQKIIKVIKEIKKYYHAKASPKEIVVRLVKDWSDDDTLREAEIREISFLEDSMSCQEKIIRKNGDVSLSVLKLNNH